MKWNKAFYQNEKSYKLFFLGNLSDDNYVLQVSDANLLLWMKFSFTFFWNNITFKTLFRGKNIYNYTKLKVPVVFPIP